MSKKFVFGGSFSGAVPLLLDLYPSTAGQYYMHKVRNTYTGACIRVRRSSDNAEQDFGFIGVDLDISAILSFVGSGNGLVTTWYSQSGFFNLTQTTLTAQPAIVLGGVLQTLNGKPCLKFDGVDDFLTGGTNANNVVDVDFFFTGISELTTNNRTFWAKSIFAGLVNRIAFYRETQSFGLVHPNLGGAFPLLTGVHTTARMYSMSCDWDRVPASNLNYRAYVDNINVTSNLTRPESNRVLSSSWRFLVGAYNNSSDTGQQLFNNGRIQCLGCWTTNQVGNYSAINTIINNYYNAY
jgi:hypothetical protein